MGIIESAPFGIGAPVIIFIAWPADNSSKLSLPAFDTPIIDNSTGVDLVSEKITAKPSIAELSNGGSFTLATTLLAIIRFNESSIDTSSVNKEILLLWQISLASSRETKYGYGLAIVAPKQNLL